MTEPHVAIVGAGFSGLLTAIHLLRLAPRARVSLVERRAVFGVGAAYDTGNPNHLLNVRLDNMSAFPDQPGHLADWLAVQSGWTAQDGFITRGAYGRYLRDLLEQAAEGAPGRLSLVGGEARTIRREGGRWRLGVEGADAVTADMVVLALGNLEPAVLPGLDPALTASPAYVEHPWRPDAAQVEGARDVLLMGAGLTMVDCALSLRRTSRRFTALSRHGLLPRAHASAAPTPFTADFSGGPGEVLRQVRLAAREHDWRAVFDRLRHQARTFWRGWTPEERGRFLRHLRPLWDVHRHRLSPGAAREIGGMIASAELTVQAGKLQSATARDDGVQVFWRPRGRRRAIGGRFDLIINCTGPLGDIGRSREPLIVDLLAQGLATPDPLGLGLAIDDRSGLTGSAGTNAGLYAIGPLTRGAFWEITAVPDLRGQALELASELARRLESR